MIGLRKKPDEDLLILLKEGNKYAFDELYNRYWAKLYSGAYKRLKQKESSEEVVQDFFVSLWLKRSQLELRGQFSAYAHTSIRYLVFAVFQKEYLHRQYSETISMQIEDSSNGTEEQVAVKEIMSIVEHNVEVLPEKCRNVYELSRTHFKNNKEIAELMGISEKTVENHLTRALRSLRLSLREVIQVCILVFIH